MLAAETPAVRRIIGPTILLQSGLYFDLLDPESSVFTIEDIAHALSNICRFTGHCSSFLSVAQHCVHVSHQVPDEDALAGLLHDAAEAFVGDVAKPLKMLLPEYSVIEARIEAAVLARFGIAAIPESVKDADLRMLATEQLQLMRNRDNWVHTEGRQPYPLVLPRWTPAEAKRMFLYRFGDLKRREQA